MRMPTRLITATLPGLLGLEATAAQRTAYRSLSDAVAGTRIVISVCALAPLTRSRVLCSNEIQDVSSFAVRPAANVYFPFRTAAAPAYKVTCRVARAVLSTCTRRRMAVPGATWSTM
jgi:hypothetical protein